MLRSSKAMDIARTQSSSIYQGVTQAASMNTLLRKFPERCIKAFRQLYMIVQVACLCDFEDVFILLPLIVILMLFCIICETNEVVLASRLYLLCLDLNNGEWPSVAIALVLFPKHEVTHDLTQFCKHGLVKDKQIGERNHGLRRKRTDLASERKEINSEWHLLVAHTEEIDLIKERNSADVRVLLENILLDNHVIVDAFNTGNELFNTSATHLEKSRRDGAFFVNVSGFFRILHENIVPTYSFPGINAAGNDAAKHFPAHPTSSCENQNEKHNPDPAEDETGARTKNIRSIIELLNSLKVAHLDVLYKIQSHVDGERKGESKPTLEDDDGGSQRHDNSGEDATKTNADPEESPPPLPRVPDEHSSDLFSSASHKEASEFVRFSLKGDSLRRYQKEFRFELSLKRPRGDYDFEVLDPKGLPMDYPHYPRHLLQDIFTAPFPTTGAHLLATVEARMHYEVFRLGTFLHFNVDHPCCLRLANAGFFYTFQGRVVQCYSCGLRWDDWQHEQNFYKEHKRRRPQCLHVQGKDTSNVPIHEDQSRFRSGADITGENSDKPYSVNESLKRSAANLQKAAQERAALRRKMEHSVNLTLGKTLTYVFETEKEIDQSHPSVSTAASNNGNKNAMEAYNNPMRLSRVPSSQRGSGQRSCEEPLHDNGSIRATRLGDVEQPGGGQNGHSGPSPSMTANLQRDDRFPSRPSSSRPHKEIVKTYSLPTVNSNSRISNKRDDDEDDDSDDDNNNYNSIIYNNNAGGITDEEQLPANARTSLQSAKLSRTEAQGEAVVERETVQRMHDETSGNHPVQLPHRSSDISVQAQLPETLIPWEQQSRLADGHEHVAETSPSHPERRTEDPYELRDVQSSRREIVAPTAPTHNGERADVNGQHQLRDSDRYRLTTGYEAHRTMVSPDLNIDDVNEAALFAASAEVPRPAETDGAWARTRLPPVSSSENTGRLCNGETEERVLGQTAMSNGRTMTVAPHSEVRDRTATTRSYPAENPGVLTRSGGAIHKTTNRQVASGRTSQSMQRGPAKPTASGKDEARRKSDVRIPTSSVDKYGAGVDNMMNTGRREDTDVQGSSRTNLNGEGVHFCRPNSTSTPNRDSLFLTAQIMSYSTDSRPAAVNRISHPPSSSVPTNSLPISQQNGNPDASLATRQESRLPESHIQSREERPPETERNVALMNGHDSGYTSQTTSSMSSRSISAAQMELPVITENHTQLQCSPGQSSGISNGITTSIDEDSHRSDVLQRREQQQTPSSTSSLASQAPPFSGAARETSRANIQAGWNQDLLGEHLRHPYLPSGSQQTTTNISESSALVYTVQEANRPPLSGVSQPSPSQTQASANAAPGYDPSEAVYPRYRERPSRRATFVQWPPHLHQDPDDLADAGFFFAGAPDCVRCFFCGLGLKDWDAEDDPFEEHARWRGACAYLGFFQEEQIRTRRQALLENRPVGSVFHIHGSRGDQGPVNVRDNLAVSTQSARATPRGFQGEDWLTSPAAQSAREMGFEDDVIQYAIVALLNTNAGRRAVTSQNLVQAILYIRERNENGHIASNGNRNDDGNSDDDIIENFIVSDDDDDADDSDNEGEDLNAAVVAEGNEAEGSASGRKDNDSIITNHSRMTKNELKKLEEEHKELEKRLRCKVCLDSMASVLFIPCRHRVCCVDCAARLRKCPMCRRNIRGSVPIAPAT